MTSLASKVSLPSRFKMRKFSICIWHCTGTAHTVVFYVIIKHPQNIELFTHAPLLCWHICRRICAVYVKTVVTVLLYCYRSIAYTLAK